MLLEGGSIANILKRRWPQEDPPPLVVLPSPPPLELAPPPLPVSSSVVLGASTELGSASKGSPVPGIVARANSFGELPREAVVGVVRGRRIGPGDFGWGGCGWLGKARAIVVSRARFEVGSPARRPGCDLLVARRGLLLVGLDPG